MSAHRGFPVLFLSIYLIISFAGHAGSRPIVKIASKQSAYILYNRAIYMEIKTKSSSFIQSEYGQYLSCSGKTLKSFRRRRGFAFKRTVYRIPYEHLSCEGKRKAIENLFPNDKTCRDGWRHVVTYTGSNGETLWRIAVWFTGTGSHVSDIQSFNHIRSSKITGKQVIIIPGKHLLPCFIPTVRYPVRAGDLTFKKDSAGVYAEYKLQKGQTIYSHVVLRFTDRVTAPEVMDAAEQILKRSRLKSFHEIPAGTSLKIPADLISPPFLPPNDPRRIRYESTNRESSQYRNIIHTKALEGVTVILDPGHGGVDPGTISPWGEREDEYAYDVACRIKNLLESTTKAKVYMTLRDDETGFNPRSSKYLSNRSDREKILTHPPYFIKDPKFALNLRFFLANYLLDKAKSKQPDADERFVFTSLHADSLHPDAKGLMIYIPGADYYSGKLQKSGRSYNRYREVRGRNVIKMSRRSRLRAQGLSQELAHCIINQCHKNGVPTHSDQPIRKYIIRTRHPWVPAVLKYCRIPTRILIELANLKNKRDRNQLRNPQYRQKLARLYVNALQNYFSNHTGHHR